MSEELDLIKDMGESFHALKQTGEDAASEIKKLGKASAETEAKMAKIDEVYVESKANADKLAAAEVKISEMAAAFQRINQGSGRNDAGIDYKAAANAILHGEGGEFDPRAFGMRGEKSSYASGDRRSQFALELDLKTLSTDIAPNGGYAVTPDNSGRRVQIIFPTSPMRSLASVQSTSKPFLEGLYDGDEPGSQVSPERGSRAPNTTPQLGKWQVDLHNYNTNLGVTRNMRDDADFDIVGWVAQKAQAKLHREQNSDFVNGPVGASGARGFTTYADGTSRGTVQQVAAAGASTYTMGDVVKLPYSLKSEYKDADAAYVGHRTVIGDMRTKALTGNDSGLVWQPSLAAGQPDALNGYRVVEFEDMPDATTAFAGAGNIFLAFANWRSFYQIAEKSTIDLLVDELTIYPEILYRWNSRVGGDVVNFEAGKLLITGS